MSIGLFQFLPSAFKSHYPPRSSTMNANKHLGTNFAKGLVIGLQSKPLYYGTVDAGEVARRRAKGKVARATRRNQRVIRKGQR